MSDQEDSPPNIRSRSEANLPPVIERQLAVFNLFANEPQLSIVPSRSGATSSCGSMETTTYQEADTTTKVVTPPSKNPIAPAGHGESTANVFCSTSAKATSLLPRLRKEPRRRNMSAAGALLHEKRPCAGKTIAGEQDKEVPCTSSMQQNRCKRPSLLLSSASSDSTTLSTIHSSPTLSPNSDSSIREEEFYGWDYTSHELLEEATVAGSSRPLLPPTPPQLGEEKQRPPEAGGRRDQRVMRQPRRRCVRFKSTHIYHSLPRYSPQPQQYPQREARPDNNVTRR